MIKLLLGSIFSLLSFEQVRLYMNIYFGVWNRFYIFDTNIFSVNILGSVEVRLSGVTYPVGLGCYLDNNRYINTWEL